MAVGWDLSECELIWANVWCEPGLKSQMWWWPPDPGHDHTIQQKIHNGKKLWIYFLNGFNLHHSLTICCNYKNLLLPFCHMLKVKRKFVRIVPLYNMAHSHLNSHLESLSGKLGQWFTTDPTSSSLDSAHEKKRRGTNFSSNRRPHIRLADQWA